MADIRPHRATAFVDAAPIGGRGHRTRQTELLISERDRLIIEATRFYPGCRDREIARRLRFALSAYRKGRWRRDRIEGTCPMLHCGKLVQSLWMILKTLDAIPCDRGGTGASAAPNLIDALSRDAPDFDAATRRIASSAIFGVHPDQ
jgi:hypothetical protein